MAESLLSQYAGGLRLSSLRAGTKKKEVERGRIAVSCNQSLWKSRSSRCSEKSYLRAGLSTQSRSERIETATCTSLSDMAKACLTGLEAMSWGDCLDESPTTTLLR